jgi:hypothetical protein
MPEGHTFRRDIASGGAARRGQRPQHVCTLLEREPGDLTPGQWGTAGAHWEGEEPKPVMHGREKSDLAIVAKKSANAAAQAAEWAEPRAGAEENANWQSTCRAQDRESVSQALERVRTVAQAKEKERFTALLHHINPAMLRTAFFALKRDAAPGVDGVTWTDYEADLDGNIAALHKKVHSGAYRAQPARRRYIPKPDGRQPLVLPFHPA